MFDTVVRLCKAFEWLVDEFVIPMGATALAVYTVLMMAFREKPLFGMNFECCMMVL